MANAYGRLCAAFNPKKESRAYDDGAPLYQKLVDEIKKRATLKSGELVSHENAAADEYSTAAESAVEYSAEYYNASARAASIRLPVRNVTRAARRNCTAVPRIRVNQRKSRRLFTTRLRQPGPGAGS
jgi:hypothetical protein